VLPPATIPNNAAEIPVDADEDEEETEYGLILPDYNPLLD
jgi:hypothetical protein